jgi:hypothetical protein
MLFWYSLQELKKTTSSIRVFFTHLILFWFVNLWFYFFTFDAFIVEIILKIIPKFRCKLVINLATSKYILKKASFLSFYWFWTNWSILTASELSTLQVVNAQCFLLFLKNEKLFDSCWIALLKIISIQSAKRYWFECFIDFAI